MSDQKIIKPYKRVSSKSIEVDLCQKQLKHGYAEGVKSKSSFRDIEYSCPLCRIIWIEKENSRSK